MVTLERGDYMGTKSRLARGGAHQAARSLEEAQQR